MVLLIFRLVTSLGIVILAARQRMWFCMAVGLALLVIEPWAVISAFRSDGPWLPGIVRAYVWMVILAGAGWAAGIRVRVVRGDCDARREVSELPLLHTFFVLCEAGLMLLFALAV